jgi:hypothetical protein
MTHTAKPILCMSVLILNRVRSSLTRGCSESHFMTLRFAEENCVVRQPTDRRHQRQQRMRRGQSSSQGVLLVAEKPAALPGLERAPAQGRVGGGRSTSAYFVEADAGRRQVRCVQHPPLRLNDSHSDGNRDRLRTVPAWRIRVRVARPLNALRATTGLCSRYWGRYSSDFHRSENCNGHSFEPSW